MIVVLSALITGFPIWKRLVISSATRNNGPVDDEQAMRPELANSGRAIKPDPADGERAIRLNAEELTDAEGLADSKKPVVIYYNLSVFCQ